jgi:hypothetical protein
MLAGYKHLSTAAIAYVNLAGCDALSVHLILTVIAATLSIGISWKAVVGSLGIMIPWQLAHWEEYHTGEPPIGCNVHSLFLLRFGPA